MRPILRRLGQAAILTLSGGLLASCGLVPSSQSLSVTMTEGAWSLEPVAVEDANRLEFAFANEGAETHNPIVVVVAEGSDSADAGQVLADLMGFTGTPPVIYPDEESGKRGHFHPGGPDEPDLPEVAFLLEEDEGGTIRYLFTDAIEPGGAKDVGVSAGKPEFTFGERHSGTTYMVLCMNPSHAERGEHATFSLIP